MVGHATVPYDAVPTVEASGSLGGGISAHASPQDFGSQLGAATEDAGNKSFELAQKQQGMINETVMTNADADFATKVGKIKGDYTSLTGMAAYSAFPKYQDSIRQAFQDTRAGLPPAAQRGFDMMATRTMANHIADGSSYASSQLKEANVDSYSNVKNASLAALLDPSTAADPQRSKDHLDTIKYATQAQVDGDHPGLKKDDDGNASFDESTPEGKQGKAELQRQTDIAVSQGYINRYSTLMKQNVGDAYNQYQQERSDMPRSAQVALDSQFAPKIFDNHKQTASAGTLNEAAHGHWDALTNPGSQHAIDTVLNNEGGYVAVDGASGAPTIYGINAKAHPEAYAAAKNLADTQGDTAGKQYATQFYKTEYWDKKGIGDLPPETQSIVMDGVVNHSQAFGDKLISAAKAGASPQALIDMRRDEYNRLATANPDKYGASLNGWNARLDNLQQSTEGKKTYATNENGGPLSLADYYRTNSQQILARGDAYAEQQMPGDLTLKRAVRQTLQNQMQQTISNESAQHALDNRNVIKAINGEFTKGKPPETEEELRAIPGMGDLIDNISARDPKFAESIPTLIAKMSSRNDANNSSNGYGTVLRILSSEDNPNAIRSEDHLVKELGRSDGTGINKKDYSDAKPAIELDQGLKDVLSKHMQQISIANGNLDGQGQQRALAWYNQAMGAWKTNQSKGDKALDVSDFIDGLEESNPLAPHSPSRMQQISNWAKQAFNGSSTTQNAPQQNSVNVISPTGQTGTIPVANLERALSLGYKRAQ